jgi:hypothetical protein
MENSVNSFDLKVASLVSDAFSQLTFLRSPDEYFVRQMTRDDRGKKNHLSGFSYINNPCEFVVGFIYDNNFLPFNGKVYFSGEGQQGNHGIPENEDGEYINETLNRIFSLYDSDKISHLVVYKSDHKDCFCSNGEKYICEILSFKYIKRSNNDKN